jgi:23S rRNA (guanosine2251-2'-O)-methyltransferase
MKDCILILDNLRSVENTGSIFRTAEGLGVGKIILVGTTPAPVDRFGRPRADFIKVSLGAEESLQWEYQKEAPLTIKELKKEGYKIIALEQTKDSIKLSSTSHNEATSFVLVVGNEVLGVSDEILKFSDEVVEIPMKGTKESLNVSVATGIALFKLLE